MANTKISALTELAETPASGDWIPLTDVSDTTMGVSGTTKKLDASRVLYKSGGGTVSAATTFSSTLSVTGTNPYFANAVGFGTTTPAVRIHTHTSADEHLRFNHTSDTGNPFLSFYQNGTRRGFIQQNDTNDTLTFTSEYGDVAFKAASTAGVDSDTEYIRLKSGGNTGFGTTSPSYRIDAVGTVRATSALISPIMSGGTATGGTLTLTSTSHATKGKIYFGPTSMFDEVNERFGIGNITPTYRFDSLVGAGSQDIARFGQSGVSNGLTIQSNGTTLTYTFTPSVTIVGGTVTCVALVQTSSIELKDNLVEIPTVLDNLTNIKTYYYNRKNTGVKEIGLIAEQVEQIYPEAVATVTVDDGSGAVTTKGINYGSLAALTFTGLKELIQRLKVVKNEITDHITTLYQRTNNLDNRLKAVETKVELR